MRIILASQDTGVMYVWNPLYPITQIVSLIVLVNIVLTIFNLVPIPPLDGSKILFAIFPNKLYEMRVFFERYGLILVIIFIFFAWNLISPLVGGLFRLITGVAI